MSDQTSSDTAIQITGTVSKQALGTGFWGITTDSGDKYRPTEMPKELQTDGLKVSATVRKVVEQVSIFMWGTAVEIVEFDIAE